MVQESKGWFRRHWLMVTLVIIAIIIISAFVNNSNNPKKEAISSETKLSNKSENSYSAQTTSTQTNNPPKYTASEVEKMSLNNKLDICTKDIAGDAINIPEAKDQAYSECYQLYYSGGEEALNEYLGGIQNG